jgi:5-methylcytosine-specific restriction protein B
VARVFGEALTYLEPDKRGRKFQLASGKTLSVPPNLVILATMNPWDKGVDELDVALERRFAQIDMPPDPDALRNILTGKGADAAFIERVVTFFKAVQAIDDDMVHLGHAYFNNCVDEESAGRAWTFRLLPFFTKACRLDKETLSNIKRLWLKVAPAAAQNAAAAEEAPVAAPEPPAAAGEQAASPPDNPQPGT